MSNLTPTKEEAMAYCAIRKRHKLTIRELLPALLGAIEPESEGVVDFVENLPHVRLGKLPDQVDTCTLCQLEFGNETEESDSAVRLSCGHFFGADCLKRRFMQHESCSICRVKVFDRPIIEDWAFPEMRSLVANFIEWPVRFFNRRIRMMRQIRGMRPLWRGRMSLVGGGNIFGPRYIVSWRVRLLLS